jgi:hypothetical protein
MRTTHDVKLPMIRLLCPVRPTPTLPLQTLTKYIAEADLFHVRVEARETIACGTPESVMNNCHTELRMTRADPT